MNTISQNTIDWLLAGPSWARYRTLLDLLGMDEKDLDVNKARNAMLSDLQIKGLIEGCQSWEEVVLKRHNDAFHPLHQLGFLAEIGLNRNDPGLESLIARITTHCAIDGPFEVLTNIPVHFGGSGKNEWSWMLCDAPLLLYCLARFGLKEDVKVKNALQKLLALGRSNGCRAPLLLNGKFHGPGRRDDPCPYATY